MAETITRGAFAYPGTTLAFKTGTWRTQRPSHQLRTAPCDTGCPAGNNPQAFIAAVEEGRPHSAWEFLVATNPLPAITGRVCEHPCESGCNRRDYDQPIAIHNIERYLGDEALRLGWDYPVVAPVPGALPVAVVGAGPAGLSAAYHLTRLGYQVSLFESLPNAGGTCRMAIPGYRLSVDVLNAEVERLLGIGIEFLPQRQLGRDVSLQELQSSYRAVFLGPGAQQSKEWNVDGATPRDLHAALDMLKEWIALGSVISAKSAAIVGNGNTAIDLARILKRAGLPEVHVISHNALPCRGLAAEDTMRALPREIDQALEEGVIIHEHRGIRRLILRGKHVVGLELVHMKKMPDASGNLRRVAFEGTETVLHVDQVIPAIGQKVDAAGMDSLLGRADFFDIDPWGQIVDKPGIFAGGDACPNRNTVSAAIGDGRRGAQAMDAYIRGQVFDLPDVPQPVQLVDLNLNYFEHAERAQEPVLPVEQRFGAEEIEGGLSEVQVMEEAQRCFSCGNCFACDNCWTLCPDGAVLKTREQAADGSHYVFDYDYCKGCGLCAYECPCGYIAMAEEF